MIWCHQACDEAHDYNHIWWKNVEDARTIILGLIAKVYYLYSIYIVMTLDLAQVAT